MTATLTSIAAQPIIDVTPIPAHTNEMGSFELALDRVCQGFAGLDAFGADAPPIPHAGSVRRARR